MPASPSWIRLAFNAGLVAIVGATASFMLPSDSRATARSIADQSPVAMTVHSNKALGNYDPRSIGLSLEASSISDEELLSSAFPQYLRTLGTGTIRLAANGSDESFWTSSRETPPSWAKSTMTPADFERLKQFASASGWNVLIGLNLKHYDPARAADAAVKAKAVLGSSLEAVSIGNEPDVYYDDFNKYIKDFDTYVGAIRKAAPGVRIMGGDFQGRKDFAPQFAKYQMTSRNKVTALTNHFYPQTNCPSEKKPSVGELLSPSNRVYQEGLAKALVASGSPTGLSTFIDETNSVSCEGAKGVSDVFASALWAVDYAMTMERGGVAGLEFHGSLGRCGATAPAYKLYTPLCRDASTDMLKAQPQLYGIFALRQISAGTFAVVDNPAWEHVRTYAIRNGAAMSLVMINVDNPKTTGAVPANVQIDQRYSTADALTLETSSASGAEARTGIAFGGRELEADGTITSPIPAPVSVDGGTVSVLSRPSTVTIVRLS